jgi:alpha-D-xyloside xylohydrolase
MAVLPVLLAALCSGAHATSRLTVKDGGDLDMQFDAWGNDAVRIRIGRAISDVPSTQALLDEPPEGTGTPSAVTTTSLTNGNLRVTAEHGLIKIERVSDNKVLLVEKNHTVHDGAGATISFAANGPTEVLYGMGEHRHTATPANSGGSVRLPKPWTKWFQDSQNYGVSFGGDNTVPILHSSLGYSVLWNSPAFGSANFSDATLAWEAVEAVQLDLWIAVTPASLKAGESALAPLLRGYVDVTGHAPKLPFWATGFWQCKNRYRNQSQVLDVARGYVKRGLPISVIVIDYMHWQHLGDWRLNKGDWVAGPDGDGTHGACWPDPKAMVAELKEYGIEVMVSMWPLVLGPASPRVPCVINTTNGAGGDSCSINWKTLLDEELLVGNGAGKTSSLTSRDASIAILY